MYRYKWYSADHNCKANQSRTIQVEKMAKKPGKRAKKRLDEPELHEI